MARLGHEVPRLLAERGIEIAFGLPARPLIGLLRGVPDSALRWVTARTAAGAGFMAAGHAHARGAPAACVLGPGPAVAGVAPALGQARADGKPVLLLSVPDGDGPDAAAMLSGLCRWSKAVSDPAGFAEALDTAFALFAAGRPGPVHLQAPAALLEAEAGALDAPPSAPPPRPAPSAAEVARAVMRLCAARNPLLLLGGGAVGIGRARAVALAERIGGPVLSSSAGRGLLPADHPLHLGGRFPAEPIRGLLSASDAVLAIGAEFAAAEWTPSGAAPPPVQEAALIRVDIDPAAMATPPAALGIVCDAGRFAEALLESLPPSGRPPPDLDALRRRAAAAMPARLSRHQPLLAAIWETLPESLVIADPCEPAAAGVAVAAPPAPGRWWSAAAGYGAAGCALPAAVGAKLADPRRPVVALCGDGGVLGAAAELATAVEQGAHVLALVWNNSGLNEVREQMRAARMKPFGVDLSPVDFQGLARGFGAGYARVAGPDQLREALRAAVARAAPCLIELREEYWFG